MCSLYDIDTNDEEKIKLHLIGLAMGCPYQRELDDCPLKAIRTEPYEQRITLIKEMSHQARVDIYHHHRQCLHRLESA